MNLFRNLILFLLLLWPALALHGQAPEALPLSSNVIEGGAGTAEDLYFAFSAGPGEVAAIAESVFAVDAADASLQVEFLGVGEEGVLTALAGEVLDRGRQRVEEALRRGVADLLPGTVAQAPVRRRKLVRVALPEAQTVVLRIRAGSGISRFKVKLEGPIELVEAGSVATQIDDATQVGDATQVDGATQVGDAMQIDDASAPSTTEEVAFVDEQQWNAGNEPATTDAVGETTASEEETAVVPEEVPPAKSEARPPIRIPGRKTPPIVIPGKRSPGDAGATARPPIRIPSARKPPLLVVPKLVTGAAKTGTAPKITGSAPSKSTPKASTPSRPPVKVKIPSLLKKAVPKGGAQ